MTGNLLTLALGTAGAISTTILLGIVGRDAYACLPRLQVWCLRISARSLPDEHRNQAFESWSAEIADLPPSEILRTIAAINCIRTKTVARLRPAPRALSLNSPIPQRLSYDRRTQVSPISGKVIGVTGRTDIGAKHDKWITSDNTIRAIGILLLAGSICLLLMLITYDPNSYSINNPNRDAANNLFGEFGQLAADILLQAYGAAVVVVLAPPAAWGIRAALRQPLSHVMWRAFAWPIGSVFVAAGLGIFMPTSRLPAGDGGLIGIAVAALSSHVAMVWDEPWIAVAIPLVFLIMGLMLAFIATGLTLFLSIRISIRPSR